MLLDAILSYFSRYVDERALPLSLTPYRHFLYTLRRDDAFDAIIFATRACCEAR